MEKEKIEGEKESPHFVKIIDYAKEEPWRTDVILGQKGIETHSHIALSGSGIWYAEDEKGNVIIERGKVVTEERKEENDNRL